MGYRVEYGSMKTVRDVEKRKSHVAALTGSCLLLFFFLVGQFWPRGAEVLREILLPDRAAVAASAMEDMAQDLQEGTSFSEALKDFFTEIWGGTGDS